MRSLGSPFLIAAYTACKLAFFFILHLLNAELGCDATLFLAVLISSISDFSELLAKPRIHGSSPRSS